ncbi:hypothetical protein JFL43_16320 [Viridibacillus sp. YIM B01967]|uniref:Metallo-beta-lactamase domain-containing protein n=1 Tax=Viridibacillus soli TaxID=2798301 RepID=A0ABS1HAH5_9BACL|nr:MBL fold metallo-hydrolase [Viridibacillus soli]MBK3496395.1 hypothetical protein [Viridibacillus soli]
MLCFLECLPLDYSVEKEGALHNCSFTLQILFTLGHSLGDIFYHVNEEGIIISGDVLFKGGVGRTDIDWGDQNTIIETICKKLLTLPEKALVLSGHGAVTDIQIEQEKNPFLKDFLL